MRKAVKRIIAAVIAGVMAINMTIAASAECQHTTFNGTIRAPYYTRTRNVTVEVILDGDPTSGGPILIEYATCMETTKYGQLYQTCVYCGYTIGPKETSMGTTHSISHL